MQFFIYFTNVFKPYLKPPVAIICNQLTDVHQVISFKLQDIYSYQYACEYSDCGLCVLLCYPFRRDSEFRKMQFVTYKMHSCDLSMSDL